MIQDELLSAQVGLFTALADPTRLQVLKLLHQKGPMHVTKIYEALGKPQNLISHHLNCLRTCGLAEMEKQGRMAIYRVANPEIDQILDWAQKQVVAQAERILSCSLVKASRRDGKRSGRKHGKK
ncbi:MAG: metalloregulator ArsR/SmtB family transcription factor (plasmid) [Candidatus Manganitrophus sp.]|nr:metalloregulator ArsR/SmtB family transcription factor [Candidatus Manganitrophus sp.]MDC4228266.1 metalloregulator ArsR/SmtB family transcription factor [Candidatus Manganitrophus sp.]WDT73478.1 MAG: metalloregulator ArsR/SmtB family transcription factor [Candidatus Manganitrophus sp.]WDT77757.1 MAG: metalloregulator ArsR/SmtB family transcription factor [Candidatus Manganitrophus sp.]WDT82931.1 MAG: metalloregulator ArsR/SmtB family transcription factor [Candidatus Manganitrophus sp.]